MPTIAATAMSYGIDHPINDPALVSYHRPELVALLPQLEQALDCWMLLNSSTLGGRDNYGGYEMNLDVKEKYLLREPAEPPMAYKARVLRSTYTPIFRDSIRSYAGLLSRFQIIDAPPSMEQNDDNVDMQGSSMQSFLTHTDELALRDGGCYIMVDMMPDNGNDNFFDQARDGRHPYFLSVKRCDVINWRVNYNRGVESVEQVTVRQLRAVPDRDSAYGEKIEPVYFVLTPGMVRQYRLIRGDNGWSNRLVEEMETSLPIVPLVWYGATTARFGQGGLPMDGLAELSIQHFQMRSDLNELLHKCAMPVPVRKGAPIGADGQAAPLVLGPNTAVDLPADGGDFDFAEPSGNSLARHQEEIKHVEQLMDRSSLNFLYGSNVKTATEASLRASQVSSSVAALVRNKMAMFGVLVRLWAWYAGEQGSVTNESGLAINDSLMSKPLEASEIAQLVNLYSNELLSRRTVLDELQRGGVLDPDLVVDDEIERLEEQHEDQLEQSMEDAQEQMEFEDNTGAMDQDSSRQVIEEFRGSSTKATEQEKVEQAARVAQ